MHQRYIAMGLAAALLCAAPGWSAVIYKWVDADGVIHFSDQPKPGAERIITQSAPNAPRSSPAASRRGVNPVQRQSAKTEPNDMAVDYTEFSIDAPQPDQSFFGQDVNVRLHMEPALKPGHLISLYLNGKLVEGQPPKSTQFTLTGLARGAYTLTASVMDASSGESMNSAPVTFFVHQASLLSPLRRKK